MADSFTDNILNPSIKLIKKHLTQLNYNVKTLSIRDGLGKQVPADANVVFVIGPSSSLSPEENIALYAALEKVLAA